MSAGFCHIQPASVYRRKIVCYRGRRSRSWTPPLRLATRVIIIATIMATPFLMASCYYVSFVVDR